MARLPRLCPAGMALHVIHRGNNRHICFVCDEDFQTNLVFLREGALAYGVKVHAWVLMTNHVHILATSVFDGSISKMMQYVGRHYVRYFNSLYQRTGTLWQSRFKSCLVDNDIYFLTCQRYIELKPVRAGMVKDPCEYRWSSYQANAFGVKSTLISEHDVYLALTTVSAKRRQVYRALFEDGLNHGLIENLRQSTNSCMAFGSDQFKDEAELLYERRVKQQKPGPKSK